jgi:hypothetical protein
MCTVPGKITCNAVKPIDECNIEFAGQLEAKGEVTMKASYSLKTPMVTGDYVEIGLGGFSSLAVDIEGFTTDIEVVEEIIEEMPVIIVYEIIIIEIIVVTTTTTVTTGGRRLRRATNPSDSCYYSLKAGNKT